MKRPPSIKREVFDASPSGPWKVVAGWSAPPISTPYVVESPGSASIAALSSINPASGPPGVESAPRRAIAPVVTSNTRP